MLHQLATKAVEGMADSWGIPCPVGAGHEGEPCTMQKALITDKSVFPDAVFFRYARVL